MDIKIKTYLADIHQSIIEIESFLPEKRNFIEFQKDIKTRKAIERNIEIIGEAMSRILKIQNDFPIHSARKIVDTRNRISHGYDSISEDVIWAIVQKDLLALKQEIQSLLNN